MSRKFLGGQHSEYCTATVTEISTFYSADVATVGAPVVQAIYLITDPDVHVQHHLDDAPSTRTREIFAKMDSNRDGILSKDEFVKGCLEDSVLYHMLACRFDE